ncbi:hypothetical protein HDK77DRAFT_152623 [Phyllosticta capitalensis]
MQAFVFHLFPVQMINPPRCRDRPLATSRHMQHTQTKKKARPLAKELGPPRTRHPYNRKQKKKSHDIAMPSSISVRGGPMSLGLPKTLKHGNLRHYARASDVTENSTRWSLLRNTHLHDTAQTELFPSRPLCCEVCGRPPPAAHALENRDPRAARPSLFATLLRNKRDRPSASLNNRSIDNGVAGANIDREKPIWSAQRANDLRESPPLFVFLQRGARGTCSDQGRYGWDQLWSFLSKADEVIAQCVKWRRSVECLRRAWGRIFLQNG